MHALPSRQLDETARGATRLAHIGDATEVHFDPRRIPRLGIPGGGGSGGLDNVPWDLGVAPVSDDDVAPRTATGNVQPQVVRLGDFERENVVVFVPSADENFEAADDERSIRASFACHGISPRGRS